MLIWEHFFQYTEDEMRVLLQRTYSNGYVDNNNNHSHVVLKFTFPDVPDRSVYSNIMLYTARDLLSGCDVTCVALRTSFNIQKDENGVFYSDDSIGEMLCKCLNEGATIFQFWCRLAEISYSDFTAEGL